MDARSTESEKRQIVSMISLGKHLASLEYQAVMNTGSRAHNEAFREKGLEASIIINMVTIIAIFEKFSDANLMGLFRALLFHKALRA